MPNRSMFTLAAVLALYAAVPVDTALADDICRRPCQFYVPQKGEADPTVYGCHDLIDNLSGTCGISVWDLPEQDDVEITVHSTPRAAFAPRPGNRHRFWIELG